MQLTVQEIPLHEETYVCTGAGFFYKSITLTVWKNIYFKQYLVIQTLPKKFYVEQVIRWV